MFFPWTLTRIDKKKYIRCKVRLDGNNREKDPMKEAVWLLFPYGEWIIMILTVEAWAESRVSKRLFLMISMAWIAGKGMEAFFSNMPLWHWHLARLAVMLVFFAWARSRAERKLIPFILASFTISVETLFTVNEPGIFPYEPWLFAVILFFVSWLTAQSFWGTAFAFTGSVLLNQGFVRFAYDGLVRHADMPDPFIWNFGVISFTAWSGLRLVWQRVFSPLPRVYELQTLTNEPFLEEPDLDLQ